MPFRPTRPAIPSQLATLAKPRPTSLPTQQVPQATAVPVPQPMPHPVQSFPTRNWIPPAVQAAQQAQFNLPNPVQQQQTPGPLTGNFQPFQNPPPPAVTTPTQTVQNTLMQPPSSPMQQPPVFSQTVMPGPGPGYNPPGGDMSGGAPTPQPFATGMSPQNITALPQPMASPHVMNAGTADPVTGEVNWNNGAFATPVGGANGFKPNFDPTQYMTQNQPVTGMNALAMPGQAV